ncbi:MAG TPA: phospho-sugar mutase [Streptosporangiaceae bacterium]|nr:phospho-sugar mutase [Streptosporangiaceae bacterium]
MAAEAERREVGLREAVEAWIADDPDPADRAELRALLDASGAGGVGEARDRVAELRDRFAGRLTFGTAGLRGVVAAGPNRMNRAVVRAATAAVAGWLLAPPSPEAAGAGIPRRDAHAGVVVGCDARHRSAEFADEVARVLAAAGIGVHVLPLPCPTPLLAFAVRHLAAAAGIMVTASHNPAADNGYKLYLSDGAQVIPPADREIEARIAALGKLSEIPVADAGSPLITRHGDEIATAYLDAIVTHTSTAHLTVVYTPMHGVAGALMLRAIERAGYPAPHVVAAQAEPDPDFPTVAFPNPEEPGALDLALADAQSLGADLVIANDPDGDRLAVALPGPDGWRTLTGDQLGALLGAAQLRWTADLPQPRLAATTIVSSTMLGRIAQAAGVRYAETLTGFKWIARAAGSAPPGTRFVFGYEEALGYAVGDVVHDKDGMSAGLAMLRLASEAKAAGRSVAAFYDELETAYGVHLTAQVTLRTTDPAPVMARLRAAPPAAIGGAPVTSLTDLVHGGGGLPPSDVLIFRLDNARVVLRPSGTEPKIKCYIEITEQLDGRSLAQARKAAADRMAPLHASLESLLAGLPGAGSPGRGLLGVLGLTGGRRDEQPQHLGHARPDRDGTAGQDPGAQQAGAVPGQPVQGHRAAAHGEDEVFRGPVHLGARARGPSGVGRLEAQPRQPGPHREAGTRLARDVVERDQQVRQRNRPRNAQRDPDVEVVQHDVGQHRVVPRPRHGHPGPDPAREPADDLLVGAARVVARQPFAGRPDIAKPGDGAGIDLQLPEPDI